MKITYFANFSENNQLKRENDIKIAFEKLGHEVVPIDESDFDMKKLIETANKSDLFFFHHGGIMATNALNFQGSLARIELILKNITCKKAFWFFEKILGAGENYMELVLPLVDYGFVNDDTWRRRHKYANLFPAHLAWGEGVSPKGKYKKEYNNDIVFMGSVYNTRVPFMESMQEEFGDKFKVYNNKFGQDFADMCESSKIIVSPKSPFDDFYWSDRVYRVLVSKGFLIHPRLEGLKEEFKGVGLFETYNSWEELVDKIKYWLNPERTKERKQISKNARDFVFEKFSYLNRVKGILNIMQ